MKTETVNPNNLPPLLRISDLCNDRKAGTRGVLNCSRSYFLQAVKDGRMPQPIYMGERLPLWRKEDIEDLLQNGIRKKAA